MSGIEELRERVLAAEERVGLNDAQRAAYSERLMILMNGIEGCIHDQQSEIERQAGTIEKLQASDALKAKENEQLRAMLQSMLQTIEADGRDGLADAMLELDRKVSALMNVAAVEPEAEETDVRIEEPPVETAIAVGPVSAGPIEQVDDAEDAELAPEGIEEPVAQETAEAQVEEATEAAVEPAAEVEETAEPAAEIEADAPEAEKIEEPVAEEIAEPAVEDDEPAVDAAPRETPSKGGPIGGSLDEIMERVSKLVEETEAAIEAPADSAAEDSTEDSAAEDSVEEIAEDPAQQATGTDS